MNLQTNVKYIDGLQFKLDWSKDRYGNIRTLPITNEKYTINPVTHTVQLKRIPAENSSIKIEQSLSRMNGVIKPITFIEVDTITQPNHFTFNRESNVIQFHTSINSDVLVDYQAIGQFVLDADSIATAYDSRGNVIEYLSDLIRSCNNALSNIVVVGELSDAIEQIKAYINSSIQLNKELNLNLGLAKIENSNLKSQIPLAQITNTQLREALLEAQDDINKIEQTGGKTITITTAMWGEKQTDGFYKYRYNHNLGTMAVDISGYLTSNFTLWSPNGKNIDNNVFEIWNETNDSIVVNVFARAYKGTANSLSGFNTSDLPESPNKKYLTTENEVALNNTVKDVNTIKSSLTLKANQSDLDVQKGRIDSFTQLAQGSTTGDAELVDARVGADGVIYSNTGSAIREQMTKVNTEISDVYEDKILNAKKGFWYNELGVAVASKDWYGLVLPIYKCNINGYVSVNGSIHKYQDLVKAYVFLDGGDKVIETGNSDYNHPSLKVPTNAKKIVLNALTPFSVSISSLYVESTDTKDTLNSYMIKGKPCNYAKRIISKKICKTNNSVAYFQNDNTFKVEIYKVTKGKRYYATSAMTNSDFLHSLIMGEAIYETDFYPKFHMNATVSNPSNIDTFFIAPLDGYVYINGWSSDNDILLHECDMEANMLATESKTLAESANMLATESKNIATESKNIANEAKLIADTKVSINIEGSMSYNLNGRFYYENLEVKKGDMVKVQLVSESLSKDQYIWMSDSIRDDVSVPTQPITLVNGSASVIATQNWNGFTTWGNADPTKKYTFNIDVYRNTIKVGNVRREVVVAASNSSASDKNVADYICDGVNDEVEINKAIEDMKWCCGTVILCQGDYWIDEFKQYDIAGRKEYIAICVHRDKFSGSVIDNKNQGGVTIQGVSSGRPQRTYIRVRDTAFNNIPVDVQPTVIGGGTNKANPVGGGFGAGYAGGWGFNLNNVMVSIGRRDRKCIAVNYQNCYWGIMDTCELEVRGYGENVMPCEGLIGFRGWAGWSDGSVIGANDTYANGFYVAFQMGGEHVICNRLGTRFNYCAYTFGEYDLNPNSGSQIHNITLIECCDEHSQMLPQFYKAGYADTPNNDARVGVTFIDFIIEYYPLMKGQPIIHAREHNGGAWCGRIEYTTENNENTQSVSNKFWEDGHGKYFRTLNQAHLQMGSSAERRRYAPNYCQTYWDIDVNKQLTCTEPATKTWKDAMGNIVV